MDLVLDNLQRLKCHKNQPTNQPTNGKYKIILTFAKLMVALFGSIYACEKLFSKMKYTKSHLGHLG